MKDTLPSYNFRRLLQEVPMTDNKIAEAIGVSHSTVYRWRSGESSAAVANMERAVEYIRSECRKIMERTRAVEDDLEAYKGIRYRPDPPEGEDAERGGNP